MSRDFQEQNDKFDESSLDAMNKIEEEDIYDDLEEDFITDDDDFDNEHYQRGNKTMSKATSKFNLDSKSRLYVIGGLIVLVVAVLLFNPFSNSNAEEGDSGGIVSGILGKFQSDKSSNEEQHSEPIDPLTEIEETVKTDFPDYEVTRNDENGTIIAVGLTEEGVEHIIVYNVEGEIVSELLDGEQLVSSEISDAYIDNVESATINKGKKQEDNSSGPIDVDIKQAEIPEDKVLVKKEDYEKSLLSQPIQSITETTDEDGRPIINQYVDRFIVMYEKLPLRGNTPTLYSQVIETGEVIIFPIRFEQYLALEDKGSTLIEVEVTEMYGVKSYDKIELVDWK